MATGTAWPMAGEEWDLDSAAGRRAAKLRLMRFVAEPPLPFLPEDSAA